MDSKWLGLADLGQSVWYDNVARPALESGRLEKIAREDNVTGGTSNPSIFAKAVSDSDDYDAEIEGAGADESPEEVFEHMAVADIRRACDLFRPVWERTSGLDGYVSLEEEASIAFDEESAVRRGHEIRQLVDRPNLMVKVPGTEAGVPAMRRLIAEGVNVNVTLLFSRERYREVAEAYVDGLEQRRDAGKEISGIASVASFFVSRIDSQVDERLPDGHELRGKIAIANAKVAYADVFRTVFAGERWERLAAAGGNVQRPLWASTGVKNEDYPATLYVDALIGPDTVNTVPDATLDAYRTEGDPAPRLEEKVDEAREQLAALEREGISLDEIVAQLEEDGVKQFSEAYDGMIEAIAKEREKVAG